MPRILDLKLSGKEFTLRLVIASVLGVLAFLFLYYIPSNLSAIINQLGSNLPAAIPVKELAALVQQSVPTVLPTLGLIIVVLTVLSVIFKKTLLEGPLVSTSGLVDLVYVYTLFGGGTLSFAIPKNIVPNTTASISITLTLIMYLFMAAPALTILKGILIALEHKAGQRESQSLPQTVSPTEPSRG